ncbi:hypothetical protein [Natronosalvus halobius]|uniref:hypothetical protein n=1 Tax=Natronosalvus halobius TaxID=2953746 RepID=UPI00209FE736|nr:hypothetical protein [Natronosalvus halobius]USZ72701.1 hypothetical protein NGM15_05150 [Natronosalvus halobius]
MTQRPPSPQTPASKPSVVPTGDSSLQDRAVLTTPQLADRLEERIGYRLDETALERVLIELDRHGYVEWEGVTCVGDYVWNLSESPDHIANAVAKILTSRLENWLRA